MQDEVPERFRVLSPLELASIVDQHDAGEERESRGDENGKQPRFVFVVAAG